MQTFCVDGVFPISFGQFLLIRQNLPPFSSINTVCDRFSIKFVKIKRILLHLHHIPQTQPTGSDYIQKPQVTK